MIFQSTLTQPQRNLLRSVVKGDKSWVEELLKPKSELSPQEIGRILWHAVRLGTLEMAFILVEAGADVNLTNPFDQYGPSLLHQLIRNRDPRYDQLAMSIIDHGANVNVCDEEGETVLHRAILDTRPIVLVEKLFKLGARVNEYVFEVYRERSATAADEDSLGNDTECRRAAIALYCCTKREMCFLEGAKWFLEMKFPVEEMENDGLTLQSAVQNQKVQLVKLLIDHGFDVNRPAKNGVLPLYEASTLEESTITELLVRSGAGVNARSSGPDIFGESAIHTACQNASTANVQVLLRHGADINLIDSRGRTPLSLIRISNYESTDEMRGIVIRHLAVLVCKGKMVNSSDLEIIRNDSETHKYYTECIDELETMKIYKVINDIPLFTFFREKDISELLFVTRNYDLVENVGAVHWKDQFPIFHDELDLSFEKAKRQKILLRNREEALYDSLENTLPYVPLEKIVYCLYINGI